MKNNIFFNILYLIGSKTNLQRLAKALHQLLNQLILMLITTRCYQAIKVGGTFVADIDGLG